jgi:hypothetical protein
MRRFYGAATPNQLTIDIDFRDGQVKLDYDTNRRIKY